MRLPPRLQEKAAASLPGREWMTGLPRLCARLSEQWSVHLGEPYAECHVSLVVPADGAVIPAVVKIPMPSTIEVGTLAGDVRDREAAALRIWAGAGAVELLEHDEASGAMLIERCVPGATLDSLGQPEDADQAVAAVLKLLHRPVNDAAGFDRLTVRAARLAEGTPSRFKQLGEPLDPWLVEEAVQVLADMSVRTGNDVLLHGDTHHHNLLSARRQPWLAIDPLPMIGDPAYDAVQYLLFRKGDLADPASEWDAVITRFCGHMSVDDQSVKAWTFARLVSDALAACEVGQAADGLEARQNTLWTARLVHALRG